MSQITIRGVPGLLEREIRKLAQQNCSSLSRTVIELLEGAMGFRSPVPQERDLASLAGTWDDAALSEFNDAIAPLGHVENKIW